MNYTYLPFLAVSTSSQSITVTYITKYKHVMHVQGTWLPLFTRISTGANFTALTELLDNCQMFKRSRVRLSAAGALLGVYSLDQLSLPSLQVW